MSHDSLRWIDEELAALAAQGLARQVRMRGSAQGAEIVLDGQRLVNFSSNDYLGLAADARLGQAVAAAIAQEGWGSGASPLISGQGRWHARLEERLARFEAVAAAVIFPSGFAANAGTLAALVGPGDAVFTDRKNHASLLDGCRLSRADVRPYPHLARDVLERLLARAATARRKLIVTDTLFSMDGDLAPLAELTELAERHGAMLMIDEAHATGVFGAHGRGVAEAQGVEQRVAVRVGTLSKAIGCHGGFVAGSESLARWLIHRARSYVFSTAPPGAALAAALVTLDLLESEPHRRRELLTRAAALRQRLAAAGWHTGRSASQIIPVVLGEPEQAVAVSRRLLEAGLYVPAIRPPTVPRGESCLRISVTWGHTAEMLDRLVESLARAV